MGSQIHAMYVLDGAEGCCETRAKHFGTFPTLFEGADIEFPLAGKEDPAELDSSLTLV